MKEKDYCNFLKLASVLNTLSLQEFLEGVKEEFPIYGEVPSYLSLRIEDTMYTPSTPLIKVARVYEELINTIEGMFRAYVVLALWRAGYINKEWYEGWYELVFEEEQQLTPSKIEKFIMEDIIEPFIAGESFTFEGEYMNVYNPNETITICEIGFFMETPLWLSVSDPDEIMFLSWSKGRPKEKIKEKAPDFVIVDPLVYKFSQKEIEELKKEVKPATKVLIIAEFLDLFLSGDKRAVFNEEWQRTRKNRIKELKEKYPFLSSYQQIWRIKEAKKKLIKAQSLLQESPKKEDLKVAILESAQAVELLLQILFYKKTQKLKNMSMGELLSQMRYEIMEDYGEDILKDLFLIKEYRNKVAHPSLISVSQEEALKIVKKSQLFVELFLLKEGLEFIKNGK
ncbi:MAG: HEPN domain-containing protein [Candidatus Heimdallarchaeaceae archaeon]